MWKEIRRGIVFTLVTMVLFGGAYHVALWALGRVAFPYQAEGSLIRRPDGTVIGSALIAQAFTGPGYFHPRPSAVDYNAASAGGSNDGPSNPELLEALQRRLQTVMRDDDVAAAQVPSEMVTESGSGIDPDIPPDAAELQAPRIASVRGLPVERVRLLVGEHTQGPTWGFFGRARVDVLELNLALDGAFGPPRRPW